MQLLNMFAKEMLLFDMTALSQATSSHVKILKALQVLARSGPAWSSLLPQERTKTANVTQRWKWQGDESDEPRMHCFHRRLQLGMQLIVRPMPELDHLGMGCPQPWYQRVGFRFQISDIAGSWFSSPFVNFQSRDPSLICGGMENSREHRCEYCRMLFLKQSSHLMNIIGP